MLQEEEAMKRPTHHSEKESGERVALMPTCLPAAERGRPLVAAVGESHYQEALVEICERCDGEAILFECEALLIPEFDNPHDENAVRVEIRSRTVAYLAREDAIAYRPMIVALQEAGFAAACRALVVGRDRHDPETQTLNLGVCLAIADAETCRETLFGIDR
jgi:hypothetical protein